MKFEREEKVIRDEHKDSRVQKELEKEETEKEDNEIRANMFNSHPRWAKLYIFVLACQILLSVGSILAILVFCFTLRHITEKNLTLGHVKEIMCAFMTIKVLEAFYDFFSYSEKSIISILRQKRIYGASLYDLENNAVEEKIASMQEKVVRKKSELVAEQC
ncbi:hypothetical protein J056_002396 [Wallemia ichthyophaga EXF-994]|uniref:Uncharacterized protein n=1 Tax=Wallemia ichthyophaga (strain EXF-994 / CBS 113033) TaxID=1299270 RepID=R9AAS5_WALI9|nr:uncharacterized protein J056_002396 [Wallemia ichthyophaga EXF-994]EOQ99271.1 hypothetical protein J056_002396 [Wallemia ichthyophaga EXF-994]